MASAGVGGQGAGGKDNEQGGGEHVTWLAEDRRYSKSGATGKPAARPRPKRRVKCSNCGDLCCSLARDLVCEAFKLGVVDMSRKVSLFLIKNFL